LNSFFDLDRKQVSIRY